MGIMNKMKKAQGQKLKIPSAIQNKSGQEQKSEILVAMPKKKKAQEEMVGFALIMIVVAVILLMFVAFSLRNPQKETVESYEVESFIQAFLQYTTDCAEGYEPVYYPVRKLITACKNKDICSDGEDTCEVLNSTLREIIEESWQVGPETPIKGYELEIISDNNQMIVIKEGNQTSNSKGAVQYFKGIDILFTAYY